ncbi:hypothetical protein N658DRAFT_501129 [Parathielavia hyrcaniae]|uniref:Uncharacterized protein n=1 Tax=Parathielavia hyrcaniae TaxID=113614 RepID=A0AAN6PVI7_9PEZI|nr:hypothetical protein N658DRAFT_501129 [Parathielavia hyrcaniae]
MAQQSDYLTNQATFKFTYYPGIISGAVHWTFEELMAEVVLTMPGPVAAAGDYGEVRPNRLLSNLYLLKADDGRDVTFTRLQGAMVAVPRVTGYSPSGDAIQWTFKFSPFQIIRAGTYYLEAVLWQNMNSNCQPRDDRVVCHPAVSGDIVIV